MKNFIFIIAMYIVPTTVIASTCSEFVGSRSSEVAVRQSAEVNQLVSATRKIIEDSPLAKLIQYEIIHSRFFFESLKKANDGELPSQQRLKLMTIDEMNVLSNKIYEQMKSSFENSSSDVDHLKSVLEAKGIFFGLDKSEVVDKIGEALLTSADKGYYDTSTALSARQTMNDALGVTTFIGSMGTGVLSLLGGIDYLTAYRSYMVLDSSLWQGSMTLAVSGILIPVITQAIRSKRAPKNVLNEVLGRHEAVSDEGQFTQIAPQLQYTPGQSTEGIEALRVKSERIRDAESQVPTDRQLITFGSESTQLHAELIQTFHTDFKHWMAVYSRNKDEIRARLVELKEAPNSLSENKKGVLTFLANIFQEANEATVEAGSLSKDIIALINQDLATLNEFDTANSSDMVKRDFERRSTFFRHALIVHDSFAGHLDNVHLTVSKILESLNQLSLAESAALINNMGNTLSGLDTESSLNSILEGLDEMDSMISQQEAQP